MEEQSGRIAGGMVPGGEEDPVAVAAVSAAISLKRIADAIIADIERHNNDVPGPLERIADALTGPDAGREIGQNIYNGISAALFEAWQRGAPR